MVKNTKLHSLPVKNCSFYCRLMLQLLTSDDLWFRFGSLSFGSETRFLVLCFRLIVIGTRNMFPCLFIYFVFVFEVKVFILRQMIWRKKPAVVFVVFRGAVLRLFTSSPGVNSESVSRFDKLELKEFCPSCCATGWLLQDVGEEFSTHPCSHSANVFLHLCAVGVGGDFITDVCRLL